MKRTEINCAQRSSAWFAARLGIPTASNFDCILTATGKPTSNAARQTYKMKLLAERMTGQMSENYVTQAMQVGIDNEPRAKAWYQLESGLPMKEVGFVSLDTGNGICGCSPDGMANDRGVEIKCPPPHTLVGQLLADVPPADYILQCQAGMWICGVTRWDLVLFSVASGIPSKIWPLAADEKLFSFFDAFVPAFCAELDEAEAKLVAMGGTAKWKTARSSNGEDIMG